MPDITEMIAAINADLAAFTRDRLVIFDEGHFYYFKDGLDDLSPTGLRARRISGADIIATYYARPKHRNGEDRG